MRSANARGPTAQPILPDIPRSISSSKVRTKKRVRFALTLESIEETSIVDAPIAVEIKTKKRTVDPWRDEGPLYDAYIEHLEKTPSTNIENVPLTRLTHPRPSSPSIELESSAPIYTTTYILPKAKTSDAATETVSIPLPPMHLPRIIERTASTAKKTPSKKPSPIRQRLQLDGTPPPRPHSSLRKSTAQIKREELTPPLKFASTPRTPVRDIFRTKKLVELTNDRSTALPSLTKKTTTAARPNDELFFFTSCHTDHIQPIIH